MFFQLKELSSSLCFWCWLFFFFAVVSSRDKKDLKTPSPFSKTFSWTSFDVSVCWFLYVFLYKILEVDLLDLLLSSKLMFHFNWDSLDNIHETIIYSFNPKTLSMIAKYQNKTFTWKPCAIKKIKKQIDKVF